MADNEESTQSQGGNRAVVITVMVVLLLVVTVAVIQTIQKAKTGGTAGPGAPGGGPPQMPPAAVIVGPIVTETTQDRAIATGTLRAVSKADVAAQEAGAVEKVLVDEGQEVAAGATLAILDSRRTKAQLTEANAGLASAQSLLEQRAAELRRADSDLEMKTQLSLTKAVSKSAVLDAEKTRTVAKSQLKAAQDGITEARSRLELLAIQLDDLAVKAPFSGVVISRDVEPGEWVAAGAMVASIVTVDPIEAWLRVPARFLAGTAGGSKGLLVRQSATGKMFAPANVTRIPDVDGRSQLFTVVATIPNPDRNLTPGESATGIVPIGVATDYLRIPLNAVVQSPQGTLLYVVQPSENTEGLPTGRAVPLSIAFERDGHAFVAAEDAGFTESDQVIVEGNQRLQPGQSLMIKPPADAGGPPAP
ncbi:MAG: membrane fusion protein (multidrug efflux system) [Limisphaerales bacterium]|jgi:membrane fusion protein (multidrug efflux system)